MSIGIPAELRPFVEQELGSGRFESEQDLVSAALRSPQERAAAVAGITARLADVEAGRVQPLDENLSDLRDEFGIRNDW